MSHKDEPVAVPTVTSLFEQLERMRRELADMVISWDAESRLTFSSSGMAGPARELSEWLAMPENKP